MSQQWARGDATEQGVNRFRSGARNTGMESDSWLDRATTAYNTCVSHTSQNGTHRHEHDGR